MKVAGFSKKTAAQMHQRGEKCVGQKEDARLVGAGGHAGWDRAAGGVGLMGHALYSRLNMLIVNALRIAVRRLMQLVASGMAGGGMRRRLTAPLSDALGRRRSFSKGFDLFVFWRKKPRLLSTRKKPRAAVSL